MADTLEARLAAVVERMSTRPWAGVPLRITNDEDYYVPERDAKGIVVLRNLAPELLAVVKEAREAFHSEPLGHCYDDSSPGYPKPGPGYMAAKCSICQALLALDTAAKGEDE